MGAVPVFGIGSAFASRVSQVLAPISDPGVQSTTFFAVIRFAYAWKGPLILRVVVDIDVNITLSDLAKVVIRTTLCWVARVQEKEQQPHLAAACERPNKRGFLLGAVQPSRC